MVILNRTNRRKDGCKQDRQFSKPEIKIRQLYPVSTLRRQNTYKMPMEGRPWLYSRLIKKLPHSFCFVNDNRKKYRQFLNSY